MARKTIKSLYRMVKKTLKIDETRKDYSPDEIRHLLAAERADHTIRILRPKIAEMTAMVRRHADELYYWCLVEQGMTHDAARMKVLGGKGTQWVLGEDSVIRE